MCLDLSCLSCVGKNKEGNEAENRFICLSRLPGVNQKKLYGQDYVELHELWIVSHQNKRFHFHNPQQRAVPLYPAVGPARGTRVQ